MAWTARTHGVAVVLIAACGTPAPPAEPDTSSGSTGGDSTGMLSGTSTSTTTTATTTTGPTTTGVDTTFGPGCGPDPCPAQCGPACEPTATCIASVWMCECDCPMTGTEGEGCEPLAAELELWVEPSKSPALDCGAVGPMDDAMTWQTVHDCVVLSAAGSAFRASWSPPMGEEPFEYGAAARIGALYERGWFEASSPLTIVEYGCEDIVATADCVVDVGQICLTCEGQTEIGVLCEEE